MGRPVWRLLQPSRFIMTACFSSVEWRLIFRRYSAQDHQIDRLGDVREGKEPSSVPVPSNWKNCGTIWADRKFGGIVVWAGMEICWTHSFFFGDVFPPRCCVACPPSPSGLCSDGPLLGKPLRTTQWSSPLHLSPSDKLSIFLFL